MIVWLVGEFPEVDVESIEFVRKNSMPPLSSNGSDPETIVFRQDHPGTWPRETIEAWRKRFPLARLCMAYGNWSEGEMRTGHPLPGVERVRLIELAGWLTTLSNQPRLPATATVAERIERQVVGADLSQRLGEIHTLIVTSTYETREAVKQLAESLGLVVASDENLKTIDLVLWSDGDLHLTSGQNSLRRTRETFPNAAVVALVHFPREHEVKFARSCKVYEVIGLPVFASNLAGAIIRALERPR